MAKKPSKKRKKSKGKNKKTKKVQLSKREIEIAKKKAEIEEQERLHKEQVEAALLAKILNEENTKRASHLLASGETINTYEKVVYAHMKKEQRLNEWETFISCRDTPEVSNLVEVNSYMTEWMLELNKPTLDLIFQRTPSILQVIDELKLLLELPPDNIRVENLNGLGLMYHEFEEKQQEYLDDATYHIIQDLSELYDPEIGVFENIVATNNNNIIHALWGNLFTTPENDRHEYTSQGFKFRIPDSLVMTKGIYRLLKTVYDHYSDTCKSYYAPGVDGYLKKSTENWILKKLENSKKQIALKSPDILSKLQVEEEGEKEIVKKKKKGKKGKGGGKKGKKGKKGKRGKSTDSETSNPENLDGMDEEYKKLFMHLDEVAKKAKAERKKLESENDETGDKKKKKGKKGKKEKETKGKKKGEHSGGAEPLTDTNNDTTATEGEYDEEEHEEGEEEETEHVVDEKAKKKKPKEKKPEEEVSIKVETKEERKARRRREEEDKEKDDDNYNFDFQAAGQGGGKTALDDDDDVETDGTTAPSKKKGAATTDENDSDEEKKKKKEGKEVSEGKPVKEKKEKKGKKRKGSDEDDDESGKKKKPKGEKRGRSKSKGKKQKSASGSKSKKGKKDKSSSRSKKKKENKKGKKGEKSKSKSTSKSRGRSSSKSKGKEKSGSKPKKQAKSKEGKSKSKSPGKGKTGKGKKGKSKSSSVSSKKSKSGSNKKGKQGSKSSKSSSRKKSKDSSKGKKKGGKRGRSKKGKGKKGKSKSKSKERSKTEAELAKEREILEKKAFIPDLHRNELNLRKYTIQAGVYNFTMLQVPPQPKDRGDWNSRIIEADRIIKEVPFEVDYEPPSPPNIEEEYKNSPEGLEDAAKAVEQQKLVLLDLALPELSLPTNNEEEAELAERKRKLEEKLMEKYGEEKERRLNKLISISIQVPNTVLWLEPPIPVKWDPDSMIWTTDGFYTIQYNSETMEIVFHTSHFGIIALADNRWSNLPYISWEFKPLELNKGKFSIITPKATLEFTILKDLICLSSLNSTYQNKLVQNAVLNVYMKPGLLIQTLRSFGLDVFPEFDSYAYVDGILVKQIDLENHVYQCMAIIAPAFIISWSKWNLQVGRNKIVFQIKEKGGSADPLMIYNDARTCYSVKCTETSETFSEERSGEAEYSADLIQLIHNIGNSEVKETNKSASPPFVETIRLLISSIRPLSFC